MELLKLHEPWGSAASNPLSFLNGHVADHTEHVVMRRLDDDELVEHDCNDLSPITVTVRLLFLIYKKLP